MMKWSSRALKYNGGVAKEDLARKDMKALQAGIVNLEKHISNIHKYGVPIVVALNAFASDTQEEIDYVQKFCEDRDCEFSLAEVWEKGGEGARQRNDKARARRHVDLPHMHLKTDRTP